MSESVKEILKDVLPEQYIIRDVAVFRVLNEKEKVRLIPECYQDDVDVRIMVKMFPGDRFWVTDMYAHVTAEEVLLTVRLSADMTSTTSAVENLKLLHNLNAALAGEGVKEVEVKDRPDIFAWEASTNKTELPEVVKCLLGAMTTYGKVFV